MEQNELASTAREREPLGARPGVGAAVDEVRRFLRLDSGLFAWMAGRVLFAKSARRTLSRWLDAMHLLDHKAGSGSPDAAEARREASALADALWQIIGPDSRVGLFATDDLKSLYRVAPLTAGHAHRLASLFRILKSEAFAGGAAALEIVAANLPISSSTSRQNPSPLRQYAGHLRETFAALTASPTPSPGVLAFLTAKIEPPPWNGEQPLDDHWDSLERLYDWHRTLTGAVHQTLGRLQPTPTETKWLLESLAASKPEFDFSQFVQLTWRSDLTDAETLKVPQTVLAGQALVMPALRGRLSKTFVRSRAGRSSRPIIFAPGDVPPVPQVLWSVFKTAVSIPESQRVVDGQTLNDSQLIFATELLHDCLSGRAFLEARPLDAAKATIYWLFRPGGMTERESDRSAATVDEVRRRLERDLCLKFEKQSNKEVTYEFSTLPCKTQLGGDSLTLNGQPLIDLELVVSAGPNPAPLINHLREGRKTWGSAADFQSLLALCDPQPARWYELRTAGKPEGQFPDLIRTLLDSVDADLLHRSPLPDATWEQWFAKLQALFNSAMWPGKRSGQGLAIASRQQLEAATNSGVTWHFNRANYHSVCQLCRTISLGGATYRQGTIGRSCGTADVPDLVPLHEDYPQMSTARTLPIDPHSAQFRAKAFDYLKRSWSDQLYAQTECAKLAKLIGATLFPQRGAWRYGEDRSNEPVDVVEWRFDDSPKPVAENEILEVGLPTFQYLDAPGPRFHGRAGAVPERARVVCSRGTTPLLLKVLEERGTPGAREVRAQYLETGRREPLIRMGVQAVNSLQGGATEPGRTVDFDQLRALADGLSELGCDTVPAPAANGKYTRDGIKAQLVDLVVKGKWRGPDALAQVVADAPDAKVAHRHDAGDIAFVTSFAFVHNKQLIGPEPQVISRVRYVESLGPRSPETKLAMAAAKFLASADVPRNLRRPDAALVKQVEELDALSASCYDAREAGTGKADRALAGSAELLVDFLADLDGISDLVNVDTAADGGEGIRVKIARFLSEETAVELIPAWPATRGDADTVAALPEQGRRFVETACPLRSPAGVCQVLSRRAVSDGRTLRRDVVVGLEPEVDVPLGTELRALRLALRREGRTIPQLAKFLDQCDMYAARPLPQNLMPIIGAAEILGRDRVDRDDPPGVREAISNLEAFIREKLSLRRIEYRRWQTFPVGKEVGYDTEGVKLDRRAAGLVVRVLQPAFKDENGAVNSRGLVLITE